MSPPKTRSKRLLAIGIALVLVSGGTAIRFALAANDVFVPELQASVPAEKLPAIRHVLPPTGDVREGAGTAGPPPAAHDRIPASLAPVDVDHPPIFSSQIIDPTNAWAVSDGRTLVAVSAGSNPPKPEDGRLAILRQDKLTMNQDVSLVDVPDGGALRIVNAPRGAAVETSAQRGKLIFKTATGRMGILDLASDTATLSGR